MPPVVECVLLLLLPQGVATRARSLQPLGSRLDSALDFAGGSAVRPSRSELFGPAYREQLTIMSHDPISRVSSLELELPGAGVSALMLGSSGQALGVLAERSSSEEKQEEEKTSTASPCSARCALRSPSCPVYSGNQVWVI